MASTRGHLLVLGGNPLDGSDALDSRIGACLWDLSLGQRTGDGRFDGEAFLGGLLIFSGGEGKGEEELQDTTAEAFSQDDASSKQPCLYFILYIQQWKFRCSMRQTIANGGPDPRCPGQTRVMFKLRQPVDPFHVLKTVKGLLYLVPPRTPRSSGYDVLCTCGVCYMLFLLYV